MSSTNIETAPEWMDGKRIDEVRFCASFLQSHPMVSVNGTFFTADGLVSDENLLKKDIYDGIKQRDALMSLLGDINPLNAKKKAAEIEALLNKYIPGVEKMRTRLKKYNTAYKELKAEVQRYVIADSITTDTIRFAYSIIAAELRRTVRRS